MCLGLLGGSPAVYQIWFVFVFCTAMFGGRFAEQAQAFLFLCCIYAEALSLHTNKAWRSVVRSFEAGACV